MSEMIERVAKAIYEDRQRRGESENGYVANGEHWRMHLSAARAAIEAMREPTQEMVKDTAATWDLAEAAVPIYWRLMIDLALAPAITVDMTPEGLPAGGEQGTA